MRAIKAHQHSQRAPQLNLFQKQRLIDPMEARQFSFLQAIFQICSEALEGKSPPLHQALAEVPQVICSDPVYPSHKAAFPSKSIEALENSYQDFLSGISRILPVPKHA